MYNTHIKKTHFPDGGEAEGIWLKKYIYQVYKKGIFATYKNDFGHFFVSQMGKC